MNNSSLSNQGIAPFQIPGDLNKAHIIKDKNPSLTVSADNGNALKNHIKDVDNIPLNTHLNDTLKLSNKRYLNNVSSSNENLLILLNNFSENIEDILNILNLSFLSFNHPQYIECFNIIEKNLHACKEISSLYIEKNKHSSLSALENKPVTISFKDKQILNKALANIVKHAEILKDEFYQIKHNLPIRFNQISMQIALWSMVGIFSLANIIIKVITKNLPNDYKNNSTCCANQIISSNNTNTKEILNFLMMCGLILKAQYDQRIVIEGEINKVRRLTPMIETDFKIKIKDNLLKTYNKLMEYKS